MHLFRLLLLIVFSGAAIAEEKRVLNFDVLYTEVGFRRSVEEAFPGLDYAFYHLTGDWIIGALQDFDHGRILLLLPVEGDGDYQFDLNGKRLKFPVGEPASLLVAGALLTSKGTVNVPKRASDQRIGYWIKMKSTDRFRIAVTLRYPSKGDFLGTYDPDNGWQTSCTFEKPDQDRRDSADAYEISRDSLLGRVREVLGTKDECVIRLTSRMNLKLQKWQAPEVVKIEPLAVTLTGKIELGLEEDRRAVTTQELERNLELYCDAARSAGVLSQVQLVVSDDTDDKIFRSALGCLSKYFQGAVYLDAQKKQDGEKATEPGKPAN